MSYELFHGDCLDVMATMADNSVTAIVTDPPYGLGETPDIAELMQQWITEGHADMGKGFMGRNWDVVPGPVYWREMFRIAKPGAYLLAMCGTRTVDLMSIAIRFGGWQKFDEISYHMGQGLPNLIDWCYSQGFPKSMAIDKAIDKHLGAEREVIGKRDGRGDYDGRQRTSPAMNTGWREKEGRKDIYDLSQKPITAPATPEAATWAGYGTALKPSHEIILCFRKPVDGTYANNALVHGCGGLNIDATRVPISDGATMARNNKPGDNGWKNSSGGANNAALHGEPAGRWPPNLIHDGSDAIKAEFDKAGESKSSGGQASLGAFRNGKVYGKGLDIREARDPGYGDTGSAARFFPVCPPDVPRLVYHSKASSGERSEGLDGMPPKDVGEKEGRNRALNSGMRMENGIATGPKADSSKAANHHPTVKPLSLMQWLCRLVRQPANNLILDPFGGSGTTGVAALIEGCDTIIIEREAEYIPIIRARLEHFEAEANMKPIVTKGKPTDHADLPLFVQ